MSRHIIKRFIVSLIFSVTFSAPRQVNIHLMEFDNLNQSLRHNSLARELPNQVKEEFTGIEGVTVKYAGTIKPHLNTEYDPLALSDDLNLLLMGSYAVKDEEVTVFYQLVDLENWMQISSDHLTVPIKDLGFLQHGFKNRIKDILRPFIPETAFFPEDSPDVDEEIQSVINGDSGTATTMDTAGPVNFVEKNVITALDELEFYYDAFHKLRKVELDRGQFGTRYYREFDLREVNKQALGYERNTEELLKLMDNILENPYNVVIGDMEVDFTNARGGIIRVEVPVDYSVKSNLIQEMLANLPHSREVKDNGVIILEFSRENYLFTDGLMEYLSHIKYEVTPVIYFTDDTGGLKLIILDSWKDKYRDIEVKSVKLIHRNVFKPQLAITPGYDNIQVNIDPEIHSSIYEFSIPGGELGDYSKMTVKFVHESQLDEYLETTLEAYR